MSFFLHWKESDVGVVNFFLTLWAALGFIFMYFVTCTTSSSFFIASQFLIVTKLTSCGCVYSMLDTCSLFSLLSLKPGFYPAPKAAFLQWHVTDRWWFVYNPGASSIIWWLHFQGLCYHPVLVLLYTSRSQAVLLTQSNDLFSLTLLTSKLLQQYSTQLHKAN